MQPVCSLQWLLCFTDHFRREKKTLQGKYYNLCWKKNKCMPKDVKFFLLTFKCLHIFSWFMLHYDEFSSQMTFTSMPRKSWDFDFYCGEKFFGPNKYCFLLFHKRIVTLRCEKKRHSSWTAFSVSLHSVQILRVRRLNSSDENILQLLRSNFFS